jgi:hypothetical protein
MLLKSVQIVMRTLVNENHFLFTLKCFQKFFRMRWRDQFIFTPMKENYGAFYLINFCQVIEFEPQIKGWKEEW